MKTFHVYNEHGFYLASYHSSLKYALETATNLARKNNGWVREG